MSAPDPRQEAPARAALVTGAARRLGREIALGLARDGWDVAVHYGRSEAEARDTVAGIQALGRRAVALRADLADPLQAETLLVQAMQALPGLNCVVNSAALFEFDRPEGFDPSLLARHLGPNLVSPLVLARTLHARLPDDARGVVVNLLDQKLANLNPDFFSYTLTKSALEAATRMMARALAPKLRVVAVSPGITLVSGDQSQDGFERAHRMTPLGRSSRPADIVAAIAYLASAPAITGVNLVVDGGQHLMGFDRDVMYLAEPTLE